MTVEDVVRLQVDLSSHGHSMHDHVSVDRHVLASQHVSCTIALSARIRKRPKSQRMLDDTSAKEINDRLGDAWCHRS